jgi:hypothetical protein
VYTLRHALQAAGAACAAAGLIATLALAHGNDDDRDDLAWAIVKP